ncbi:MAG: GNAT family N-acetyltransferase [Micromonosporaceae bacterium]
MVADPVLQTARLVLRRFTGDDVDLLVELDSDPEVMRFLGNGKPTPREAAERTLQAVIEAYDRYPGYGCWAAYERATGSFVGWFALCPAEGKPVDVPELGYRLRRAVWGRGYATEGSRALVAKAFTELGARRVWAETMAVNTGSRRVMEKAGLRYLRTVHLEWDDPLPGTEHGEVEYAVDRADWLAAEAGDGATTGHLGSAG